MTTKRTVSGNRRELGAALRSFRTRAGYARIEDVNELIDVSAVTMGRIEKGEAPVDRAKLKVLAGAYDLTDDELHGLLELAKQTRTNKGTFPAFVSVKTRALLELETEATEILMVHIDLVPAHFQTEGYIRALFESTGERVSEGRMSELMNVRKGRQDSLVKENPPTVRAVIHEFALRLPVGGPEVMHDQLVYLAGLCDLPNVEIQIQPIEEGAYPGMGSSFLLIRLDDDPATDRVRVDSHGEAFFRDRTAATEPYRVAWERKRVAALSLPASKALILEAARTYASTRG
ncbi:helix-turn-helix transcriptional regulator [Actinokineospora sp. NBRC 105648]|uniref:helix-turn-helix domain-containing protein n=1 Tax=Actinokineospora sp. NBRC 105648 TaxID=3032206 RepID=UPI0024A556AD|nr:helix-turn-helix transcriptional regulator [Actinokineospora sp. NBRC 105648]GLZ40223.1 transcriptional regulator [Actinokineospora sp. NBRC 105648]